MARSRTTSYSTASQTFLSSYVDLSVWVEGFGVDEHCLVAVRLEVLHNQVSRARHLAADGDEFAEGDLIAHSFPQRTGLFRLLRATWSEHEADARSHRLRSRRHLLH